MKIRERIQGDELSNKRISLVERCGKHKTKRQINLGLSIEETKETRKKGLAVHAVTKLAKNGYYGGLVNMIRDAYLVEEMVRMDCRGLEKKDYKKLGSKLRDLVPCILVTFEKEQIVIWRGKNYKPKEGGCFLMDRESFDNSFSENHLEQESQDVNDVQIEFDSGNEEFKS